MIDLSKTFQEILLPKTIMSSILYISIIFLIASFYGDVKFIAQQKLFMMALLGFAINFLGKMSTNYFDFKHRNSPHWIVNDDKKNYEFKHLIISFLLIILYLGSMFYIYFLQ